MRGDAPTPTGYPTGYPQPPPGCSGWSSVVPTSGARWASGTVRQGPPAQSARGLRVRRSPLRSGDNRHKSRALRRVSPHGYPALALTDKALKALKPGPKGYRVPDGGGLHLFVTPSGIRSWRWRYEVGGHEKTLVLGRYPNVGLAGARAVRDVARDRLRRGLDPAGEDDKPAPTFETVARDWHATNAARWKPHHAADVLASLVAEVFPAIGARPVNKIPPAMMLAVLRPMEVRGAVETARRVKQRCSAVFGYAMHGGWDVSDPTTHLLPAMAPLPRKGRRPALTGLEDARACLAAVDAAAGQPATKVAMRVLALTAVRPGEAAGLRWDELHDLDGPNPVWVIPASRMKMQREHGVPLARQAVEALNVIRRLTGRGPFAFPNLRDTRAPMSENALGFVLLRLGYRGLHVPHGWRATFSTIMNERHPGDRAVIDLMLAHQPKDAVERAYNRAEHLARRRVLAQEWADLLLDGAVPAAGLLDGPRKRQPGWDDAEHGG